MTGYELIRLLVLVEISDDYEEPAHIFENVAERGRLLGMTVQPLEVHDALVDLIESGAAKAYTLSTKEPALEIRGLPPSDQFNDFYFWITKKGKEVVDSTRDEQYPFDDEGELLPTWLPPTK